MNIGFFIPRLSSKGGAEKYVANTAKILAKRHDVVLYTMEYDGKVFPEVNGIVKELGMPWLVRKTHGLKASVILTINAVKSINRKIPKGHELYNTHLFPSNFIKRPQIWNPHEPPRMLYDLQDEVISELNPFQKLVARAYFPILRKWDKRNTEKNVKMIIANSNHSKKYTKKIYNKPVQVIYPGVDKKFFDVKKSEDNMILSVGRLYSVKGHDLIIKAFKKLSKKQPGLKLEIIGKGPMMGTLKEQAKDHNVKFRGEVTEKELLKAYSRAKAVLYYPKQEMYGMVPMEAMATSTPLIAINEGGFTEVVKNRAILTKASPTLIAEQTNRVLNSKKLRKDLGTKGKNIARNYTWEVTAKKTEEVFKKVISY